MATLTNPINKSNILSRFDDYVTNTANSGISWGTNSIPRYTGTAGPAVDAMDSSRFGGSTSGRARVVGTDSLSNPIGASNIYANLLNETNSFSNIRNTRAKLNITSSGFSPYNTGTYDTPGVIYDQTAVAYLNTGYISNAQSVDNGGVAAGNTVSTTSLETLFDNLRALYNSKRANTIEITKNICHASCHTSCHTSGRSRR